MQAAEKPLICWKFESVRAEIARKEEMRSRVVEIGVADERRMVACWVTTCRGCETGCAQSCFRSTRLWC